MVGRSHLHDEDVVVGKRHQALVLTHLPRTVTHTWPLIVCHAAGAGEVSRQAMPCAARSYSHAPVAVVRRQPAHAIARVCARTRLMHLT